MKNRNHLVIKNLFLPHRIDIHLSYDTLLNSKFFYLVIYVDLFSYILKIR